MMGRPVQLDQWEIAAVLHVVRLDIRRRKKLRERWDGKPEMATASLEQAEVIAKLVTAKQRLINASRPVTRQRKRQWLRKEFDE